jgi:streptogramin lyase
MRRIRVAEWPAHVAVGLRSVWVSGYEVGTILRVDARSGRVSRRYKTGGNPSGMAFVDGRLWFTFGRGTAIGQLDLATGDVSQFPLGHRAPGFLENIGGDLWTTTGDGQALRIDPRTGGLIASIPIPGTTAQPAAAPDGTIWIAEKERNTVTRIDPVTNTILNVSGAGRGALAIAVASGDMWVTSYAGSDVWRFNGGR